MSTRSRYLGMDDQYIDPAFARMQDALDHIREDDGRGARPEKRRLHAFRYYLRKKITPERYLQQVLDGIVTAIDSNAGTCTVVAEGWPEPLENVHYYPPNQPPKINEHYPIHFEVKLPTRTMNETTELEVADRWIKVLSGTWLYFSCYTHLLRVAWPPVGDNPVVAEVVCQLPRPGGLVGIDGLNRVWIFCYQNTGDPATWYDSALYYIEDYGTGNVSTFRYPPMYPSGTTNLAPQANYPGFGHATVFPVGVDSTPGKSGLIATTDSIELRIIGDILSDETIQWDGTTTRRLSKNIESVEGVGFPTLRSDDDGLTWYEVAHHGFEILDTTGRISPLKSSWWRRYEGTILNPTWHQFDPGIQPSPGVQRVYKHTPLIKFYSDYHGYHVHPNAIIWTALDSEFGVEDQVNFVRNLHKYNHYGDQTPYWYGDEALNVVNGKYNWTQLDENGNTLPSTYYNLASTMWDAPPFGTPAYYTWLNSAERILLAFAQDNSESHSPEIVNSLRPDRIWFMAPGINGHLQIIADWHDQRFSLNYTPTHHTLMARQGPTGVWSTVDVDGTLHWIPVTVDRNMNRIYAYTITNNQYFSTPTIDKYYYSEDNGQTWLECQSVQYPFPVNTNIVTIPNASLLQNQRDNWYLLNIVFVDNVS